MTTADGRTLLSEATAETLRPSEREGKRTPYHQTEAARLTHLLRLQEASMRRVTTPTTEREG